MKPIYNVLKASTIFYGIYYPHYIKKSGMTNSIYKLFQLLSPSIIISNNIIKIIKLLYNVRKISITWFAIYHLHYKDKLSSLTMSFIFSIDNLHSLYNLCNLPMASLFARDSKTYVIELGQVTKIENYQKLPYIFFMTLYNFCLIFST